jgi:hypothetical protein
LNGLSVETRRSARAREFERAQKRVARIVGKVRAAAELPDVDGEWLWPGRVPVGHVTAIVGPRGAAKSYLVAEIAARLSAGAAWPDGPPGPQPARQTLIVTAEDDPSHTIKPRLRACGADLQAVRVVDVRDEDGTADDLTYECVAALADAMPELKLIVIDPFADMLGTRNDRRRRAVDALLDQLAALAKRRRMAIVVVNATDRVSAGRTWQFGIDVVPFLDAGARAVWTLEPDPAESGRFLWLNARANLAGGPSCTGLAFTIDAQSGKVAWDPEPVDARPDELKPASHSHVSKTAQAAGWLSDCLADGPQPAAAVLRDAAVCGVARGALLEAKRRLGVISIKTPSVNGGWLWSLPAATDDDLVSPKQHLAALLRDRLLESAEADIANGAVVAPKYLQMMEAMRSRRPTTTIAGNPEPGTGATIEPQPTPMRRDAEPPGSRDPGESKDSKNPKSSKVIDENGRRPGPDTAVKDAERADVEERLGHGRNRDPAPMTRRAGSASDPVVSSLPGSLRVPPAATESPPPSP